MTYLDMRTLLELRKLLGADLDAVILDFASQVEDQVASLKNRFSQQDLPECTRLAHILKGSACNIGAAALARAAGSIELLMRTDNAPMASPIVEQLPELAQATLEEYRVNGFLEPGAEL